MPPKRSRKSSQNEAERAAEKEQKAALKDERWAELNVTLIAMGLPPLQGRKISGVYVYKTA